MADKLLPDGALEAQEAEARYGRVCAALAVLGEMAIGRPGARFAKVLASDEVVLTRMRAAIGVVGAAGMSVPVEGDESELLRGAVRWQRYSRGPVNAVHGACAADIARGLLRLSVRVRSPDSAASRRMRLRREHLRLLGRSRERCAAVRAELRTDAALVPLRHLDAFRREAGRRMHAVAVEIAEATDWELHGLGYESDGDGPVDLHLPARGGTGLENRLTLLLGAGFGAGAAVTVGRIWTEFLPGPGAAVAAAAGIVLGGQVVRMRRLLAERAALDRWICEGTSALRAALDEQITARMLSTVSGLTR